MSGRRIPFQVECYRGNIIYFLGELLKPNIFSEQIICVIIWAISSLLVSGKYSHTFIEWCLPQYVGVPHYFLQKL